MVLNVMYILSILFVLGFVSFSVKPSPVYGGLALVVSGGVGCGIVLVNEGSFMGLLVFLVYLGGMMVVFGYTTAMAMERYPDTWLSSGVMWGSLFLGFVVEVMYLFVWPELDEVGVFSGFHDVWSWMVYDVEGIGVLLEDSVGVASVYSCNYWLMFVAGWTMFVGLFIVIEITRGG